MKTVIKNKNKKKERIGNVCKIKDQPYQFQKHSCKPFTEEEGIKWLLAIILPPLPRTVCHYNNKNTRVLLWTRTSKRIQVGYSNIVHDMVIKRHFDLTWALGVQKTEHHKLHIN